MKKATVALAAAFVLLLTAAPAVAQWLNYPAPGIPRKADGKPDLDAPAPKMSDGKPDLSGTWSLFTSTAYTLNIAVDLKPGQVQPWAEALYKQHMADVGKDDPETIGCLPGGPRRILGGGLAKFIQTPYLLVILSEDYLTYRQIFLDGRSLPKDPQPDFVGYSVGHWDGDTLVVESSGFNDRTWLDMGGHPHTDQLRLTERFHRTSFGHMDLNVTIDDPKAYSVPWTIKVNVNAEPDTELLEYVCAETPKDTHVIGRSETEKKVKLTPEQLSKFTGTYEARSRANPKVWAPRYKISLVGDELVIDIDGKGSIPFIPITENSFSPRLGGTFVFYTNKDGVVYRLMSNGADNQTEAFRVGYHPTDDAAK